MSGEPGTTTKLKGAPMQTPADVMVLHRGERFARSYGSTVLDHPASTVWEMVGDFDNYPNYITGVTESHIDDGKAGDEVGAVRRVVYYGAEIRQEMTGHSHEGRWYTHRGIEPLAWPGEGEVGEATYENAIRVVPITDGDRTFIEWWLDFEAEDPAHLESWKEYFDEHIPIWLASLREHLDAANGPRAQNVLVVGLNLKDGVDPEDYERFAREVDKPTCEAKLPSIPEWHVHRAKPLPGSDEKPPFDYVEVVRLTSAEQLAEDIEGEVAAELGEGLMRLVEEPVMIVTERVV